MATAYSDSKPPTKDGLGVCCTIYIYMYTYNQDTSGIIRISVRPLYYKK